MPRCGVVNAKEMRMNDLTVTVEHLRALLRSNPHAELVAVDGGIAVYEPHEEGFQSDGISIVTREQLSERLPSGGKSPVEGELTLAAASLSQMIAELGG